MCVLGGVWLIREVVASKSTSVALSVWLELLSLFCKILHAQINVWTLNLMIICLPLHCHRLLVGIITYFVAGALIMKFHYQATGTDIIPNKGLWSQFPFLIKVNNDDNELELYFCYQFDSLFVASLYVGWLCVYIWAMLSFHSRKSQRWTRLSKNITVARSYI